MELDEYRRMAQVEDSHWWYRSTRALLRQVLEQHLVSGGRFLDVGAGTGATGAWMGRTGMLVAADFEPVALELHRDLHPSNQPAVCDARRLPFTDASFDAVLCVTVLCHRSIPVPAVPVAEMARVLKAGGIVCLWEPGVRGLRRAHDRVTHTGRRFSRRDLRVLLTGAGFDVERATGAYSFLVPAAAAKMVLERAKTSSDLSRASAGLGGVLPAMAAAERQLLRLLDLPAGLSVVAVGRRRVEG